MGKRRNPGQGKQVCYYNLCRTDVMNQSQHHQNGSQQPVNALFLRGIIQGQIVFNDNLRHLIEASLLKWRASTVEVVLQDLQSFLDESSSLVSEALRQTRSENQMIRIGNR